MATTLTGCWEVDIAQAIADEMNDPARAWQMPTPQFTADRDWSRVYQVSNGDLANLQCNVSPATELDEERITRGNNRFDYTVPIDFAQQVEMANGIVSQQACDTLSKLIQDVHDFYNDGHFLATLPTLLVLRARRPVIFDEVKLYDQAIWMTTLLLTVRVKR